jgi:hypothetical protein
MTVGICPAMHPNRYPPHLPACSFNILLSRTRCGCCCHAGKVALPSSTSRRSRMRLLVAASSRSGFGTTFPLRVACADQRCESRWVMLGEAAALQAGVPGKRAPNPCLQLTAQLAVTDLDAGNSSFGELLRDLRAAVVKLDTILVAALLDGSDESSRVDGFGTDALFPTLTAPPNAASCDLVNCSLSIRDAWPSR